jgi:hypothetical protein
VAALVLGVFALWRHPTVQALARGEIDWRGRRVYAPTYSADPRALQEIDLEEVHASLLPTWVIEAARARLGRPHDESAAFDALLAEAGHDDNLGALLRELRPLVLDGLEDEGGRALYLTWAWGDYLRRYRQPYWLQAAITERGTTRVLQLSTYRVMHVTDVAVGVDAHEVRIVQRLDATTLREPYLGATRRGDDFATVVLDRVDDLVVEDLWPLLDDHDDALLSPMSRHWAPPLRREVEAGVGDEVYAELVATAPLQCRIRQVVRQVRARQGCVRHRVLRRVRFDGVSPKRLRVLRAMAERERDRGCPSITTDEVQELAVTSMRLQRRPGVQAAAEALTALATRHVVMHEVRHLADRAELGGLDQALPCASCRPDMPSEARAELSGHLAAIAWGDAPTLAMYQACLVVSREPSAPHAEAMRLINTRLDRPCGVGPPPDLPQLARVLETEMLGRSNPIAMPPGFPRRFPPSDGATEAAPQ